MAFIFDNITLNQIIIHNVYPPSDDGVSEPFISQELIDLGPIAEGKLVERISRVLGHESKSLQMEIVNTSTTSCFHFSSTLIEKNDSDFIASSAEIARLHTAAHTNKAWPGGSLVIVSGTSGVSNKRCLFIIKAEPQSGFKEEAVTDHKIALEYIDNLILTPQSKLYKVGVFVEVSRDTEQDQSRGISDFEAYIFDSNIQAKDDSKAAQYFYSNFLGLKIPENAQQKTRDFHKLTKEFINGANLDSEEKLDLQQALYTYLKVDQSNTIQVASFADTYITDEEVKDDYIEFMENKNFPTTTVVKDLNLIKGQLKQRKVNFSSQIKIIGPADTFNELVEVVEESDETTTLRIQGHLKTQD